MERTSYGVVDLKKNLWPYHSMNLKHSTYSISFQDKHQYSCSSVSGQDSIFENSPAYIEGPCKYIICATILNLPLPKLILLIIITNK